MRIISLVPSLTELIIDLGLEEELVGRTKFCIHPEQKVKSIPKIGGTKAVNVSAVAALKPDLVIANKEENTKEDVEALMKISAVHVTDISNYNDAIDTIRQIGALTNRSDVSNQLIEKINTEFSKLSHLVTERKRVCYLIWKDPMMTIGHDTYIHDMLDRCGFENIYGDQDRYPTITAAEIEAKNPEYLFLSSEPFPFKEKHVREFQKIFPAAKVAVVDGEYFSWYGSRMLGAAGCFEKLLDQSLS